MTLLMSMCARTLHHSVHGKLHAKLAARAWGIPRGEESKEQGMGAQQGIGEVWMAQSIGEVWVVKAGWVAQCTWGGEGGRGQWGGEMASFRSEFPMLPSHVRIIPMHFLCKCIAEC